MYLFCHLFYNNIENISYIEPVRLFYVEKINLTRLSFSIKLTLNFIGLNQVEEKGLAKEENNWKSR